MAIATCRSTDMASLVEASMEKKSARELAKAMQSPESMMKYIQTQAGPMIAVVMDRLEGVEHAMACLYFHTLEKKLGRGKASKTRWVKDMLSLVQQGHCPVTVGRRDPKSIKQLPEAFERWRRVLSVFFLLECTPDQLVDVAKFSFWKLRAVKTFVENVNSTAYRINFGETVSLLQSLDTTEAQATKRLETI